jgi:hypothetical protein
MQSSLNYKKKTNKDKEQDDDYIDQKNRIILLASKED